MSDLHALHEADAALVRGGALPIAELTSLAAGTVRGLSRSDWWVPGPRERAAAALRGVSPERLAPGMAGAPAWRVAPATALRALHAVGLALAERGTVVAVHLGAGSVAEGSFAEALNLAALHRLPVLFVVATRDLTGAPVPTQLAAELSALAGAYGVEHRRVDGRDAEAVRAVVAACRELGVPVLIDARV